MMVSWMQRRPVTAFFILAVLIALAINLTRLINPEDGLAAFKYLASLHAPANVITSFQTVWAIPGSWSYLAFPAAPTIAAFIVVSLTGGRAGLAEWATRLKPWRGMSVQSGLGVWALAVIFFIALSGSFLIAMAMVGPPGVLAKTLSLYGSTPPGVIAALAVSLVLSLGPLFEEMGWRGFALPRLLEHYDPLNAAIILGTLWAAWHLPREIPPLVVGPPGAWARFIVKELLFFPGCIAGTVVAVYLFHKLGGSVWGGVLAHAMHNEMAVNVLGLWSPTFDLGLGPSRVLDLVDVVVAIVLLLLVGRRLGAPPDSIVLA